MKFDFKNGVFWAVPSPEETVARADFKIARPTAFKPQLPKIDFASRLPPVAAKLMVK